MDVPYGYMRLHHISLKVEALALVRELFRYLGWEALPGKERVQGNGWVASYLENPTAPLPQIHLYMSMPMPLAPRSDLYRPDWMNHIALEVSPEHAVALYLNVRNWCKEYRVMVENKDLEAGHYRLTFPGLGFVLEFVAIL